MIEPNGEIIGHVHNEPFGKVRLSYEWQGGPIIRISRKFADDFEGFKISPNQISVGDVFMVGPYRVRVLNRNEWTGTILAMREGLPARLQVVRVQYDNAYHWWKLRVILTFYVWGLAKRTEYVPLWRDIKPIGWLMMQGTRIKIWLTTARSLN